jgi:hypothetical protein
MNSIANEALPLFLDQIVPPDAQLSLAMPNGPRVIEGCDGTHENLRICQFDPIRSGNVWLGIQGVASAL